MSMRRVCVSGTALAVLFCGAVLAGQYQRTRDNKTLVWNEDHQANDVVSWSGKRDGDGYATGHGTLTWYAPEETMETGSNLPRQRYRVSSRVTGTMVQGKFADASTAAAQPETIEPAKPKKKGWFSIFKRRPSPTPAPIEATPTPRPKPPSTRIEATPPKRNAEPSEPSNAATKPTPSPPAASDSLDSLMHAPSSLKLDSPAASPSAATTAPAATPDASMQLAEPTSSPPNPP